MYSCQGDKKQALRGWGHCQEQLEWSVSLLLHFRKSLYSSVTPLQPISCSTGDFVTEPQLLPCLQREISRPYMDSVLDLLAYYPVGVGRKFLAVYLVVLSISSSTGRQHSMVGNRVSLRIKHPLLNCWLFYLLTGDATSSSGSSVFIFDKGNNNGILVCGGFHNKVS